MPKKGIVTGQRVSPELDARARELRQNMTPAEWSLWQHLWAGRLPGYHFRRQQCIGRFIVDFYCHKADLVVEVDGGIHMEQKAYDRESEVFLQDIGLADASLCKHGARTQPGRGFTCHFTGMSAAAGRSQIGELKPVAEECSLLDVIFYGQKPTTSPFLAERVSILIQVTSKHWFWVFRALG